MPDTAELEAEAADLIAAAQEQRGRGKGQAKKPARGKAKKPARGKARAKADPAPKPSIRRQRKPAAKNKPVKSATVAECVNDGFSTDGIVVGGGQAPAPGRDHVSRPPMVLVSRMAALVAVVVCAALAIAGAVRAPAADSLGELVIDSEIDVPRVLLQQWLADYPGVTELAADPDRGKMAAFAAHLAARPAVAAVDRMAVDWVGEYPGRRILRVGLQLRRPVLPVERLGGRIDWVDGAGVVLPGELAGPDDEPRVRGIERADQATLQEVLHVWPVLRDALAAAARERTFESQGQFITGIDLAGALNDRGDRGIVFDTAGGTRLVWGGAGEDDYGISIPAKVANLIHTLACQGRHAGELHAVAAINVRFDRPFAVLSDGRRQDVAAP